MAFIRAPGTSWKSLLARDLSTCASSDAADCSCQEPDFLANRRSEAGMYSARVSSRWKSIRYYPPPSCYAVFPLCGPTSSCAAWRRNHELRCLQWLNACCNLASWCALYTVLLRVRSSCASGEAIMSTAPAARSLYGISDEHVVDIDDAFCLSRPERLHPQAADAFALLHSEALADGFDLRIVSGFRDFERQLGIWNAKARGERPVLGEDGKSLDLASMERHERVRAILRWTALPGASRHHWGSDLDVIDAAATPDSYRPRLVVEETIPGGPYAGMHRWLDARIKAGKSHGFFKCYIGSGCRVGSEPWHLSFAPVSANCQSGFDKLGLKRVLEQTSIELLDVLLDMYDELIEGFVCIDSSVYPPIWSRQLERNASEA